MACSSMARCAGAHACCKSASARVRASFNVACSARRFASRGLKPGAGDCFAAADSCCDSTDLLSQPLAIFCQCPAIFCQSLAIFCRRAAGLTKGGSKDPPLLGVPSTWRARLGVPYLACPTWRAPLLVPLAPRPSGRDAPTYAPSRSAQPATMFPGRPLCTPRLPRPTASAMAA